MRICKRCLCTENIPGIKFDENGVCNYCHKHDDMNREYPISKDLFDKQMQQIKQDNKGYEFDAVIGVSGGCDSSYLLWKVVEAGLNVLAVHWDNNWNTKTATENMDKVNSELGVSVETINIPKEEYDDICRSFLYASTPDADIPNDIALTTVMNQKAEEHNCKYVINGHSFRTEGFCPLEWTYMDGKYIESVQDLFGTTPLDKYPNLTIDKQLHWFKQKIKRVRPLYHLDYNKEKAKEKLNCQFGWEWYKFHHAENKYTKFIGGYLWANKFKQDLRYVEYSALIRSGQMNRDIAWKLIHTPQYVEPEIIHEVKQRLGLSGEDFEHIMNLPVKSHFDYDTYHDYFRSNKTMFEKMYKGGLIPYTFLEKYCK